MDLSHIGMVLCDLDGTLVDSVPDLAFSVNRMLESLEMETHSEGSVRHWVGNGVERLVKRALIGELDGEPDTVLYERALPIFLQLYAANTSARSKLYPGVIEGLEGVLRLGIPLACVTNKAERFTQPLLKDLGIDHYFGCVVSGDTLPTKKPDPAPLHYAADFFKVPAHHALMVGDSINDVRAARAANFQIVCVPYGYNHGQDIKIAEPDAIISGLQELPQLLAKTA